MNYFFFLWMQFIKNTNQYLAKVVDSQTHINCGFTDYAENKICVIKVSTNRTLSTTVTFIYSHSRTLLFRKIISVMHFIVSKAAKQNSLLVHFCDVNVLTETQINSSSSVFDCLFTVRLIHKTIDVGARPSSIIVFCEVMQIFAVPKS